MQYLIKLKVARECLQDAGLSQSEIDLRISDWLKKVGYLGSICDLPEEVGETLANRMQIAFEGLFNENLRISKGADRAA